MNTTLFPKLTVVPDNIDLIALKDIYSNIDSVLKVVLETISNAVTQIYPKACYADHEDMCQEGFMHAQKLAVRFPDAKMGFLFQAIKWHAPKTYMRKIQDLSEDINGKRVPAISLDSQGEALEGFRENSLINTLISKETVEEISDFRPGFIDKWTTKFAEAGLTEKELEVIHLTFLDPTDRLSFEIIGEKMCVTGDTISRICNGALAKVRAYMGLPEVEKEKREIKVNPILVDPSKKWLEIFEQAGMSDTQVEVVSSLYLSPVKMSIAEISAELEITERVLCRNRDKGMKRLRKFLGE